MISYQTVRRRLHAKSLDRIPVEQVLQTRYRVLGYIVWKYDIVMLNGMKEFLFVLAVEGRVAGEHFIKQNAKGPKVHGEVVHLAPQNFGRNVIGRPAERLSFAVRLDLLAHAKVAYFAVAGRVEENVVEFEVPVDDALVVQELEAAEDLGRVESGPVLRELDGVDNVEHQIASVQKFHEKEDVFLRKIQRQALGQVRRGCHGYQLFFSDQLISPRFERQLRIE